jgi:hypothetical protein
LDEGNSLEEVFASLVEEILLHLNLGDHLVAGHLPLLRIVVVLLARLAGSVTENSERLMLVVLFVFLEIHFETLLFYF